MILYDKKVEEEKAFFNNNKMGPLERAITKDLNYSSICDSGVYNDFAGDDLYTVNSENTILHKYQDRLLVLVTKKCVKNCAYCFRQINLETSIAEESENLDSLINQVLSYISTHDEIKEVILSGGDPITLGYDQLNKIFETIATTTKIKDFRLHTRAIVYEPELITDEITMLLKKYDVRVVFHIIHPYEICNIVEQKIKSIVDVGIRCYNQFPLLRNVNDHVEVVAKLLYKLDNCHVRNLTIFMPDPIMMLEEYRISVKRMSQMYEKLETEYPAWINAIRFMFDSAKGKISIKNLIHIDEDKNIALFKKRGEKVEFPDIPAVVDQCGDLDTMLWKNNIQELRNGACT